jgi:hypothetical protein
MHNRAAPLATAARPTSTTTSTSGFISIAAAKVFAMRFNPFRSKFGKIAAAVALAATAFIPMAVGQKAADLVGVVAPPETVTVRSDGKLHRLVRQVEARNAPKAFDRDTGSSYTAFGPSTMTVTFAEAKNVTGLRVYGKAPYQLTVQAVEGGSTQVVAGLESVDLSKLTDGWNTLAADRPVTAAAL